MKLVDTNPFLESVRAAWRNSPAYRRMQDGQKVEGTAGAALPKKRITYHPDMPVEDYERYLADLAQP